MTIASTRSTRVILALVVPCIVFVVYGDLSPAALSVILLTALPWLMPEYVVYGRKRPFTLLASLIVPPVLTILLILMDEEVLRPSGFDVATVFPGPTLISLGAGLVLLARVFRFYAIPLSLVYLPEMLFILVVAGYPLALSYEGR